MMITSFNHFHSIKHYTSNNMSLCHGGRPPEKEKKEEEEGPLIHRIYSNPTRFMQVCTFHPSHITRLHETIRPKQISPLCRMHSAAYYKGDKFEEKKKTKKKAATERRKRMYTTHTHGTFTSYQNGPKEKKRSTGVSKKGRGVTINGADKALQRRSTRR